jgi:acyl-CoA dehydrogenase family protein 9
MIFEGTNEILRVLVALSGMKEVGDGLQEVGRALKAPLSSFGILSDYAARRVRLTLPSARLSRIHPALAQESALLAKYTRVTGAAVETLLRKYGKGVITKEYHHERLANIAIDLYGSMAVISRATAALEKRGPEKAEEEARLARLFVAGARRRIVGHLKDMDRNVDKETTAVSETAYRDLSYAFSYWE